MFPSHPERLPAFDYLGSHRYHVRFCTYERREILVTAEIVEAVLAQIRRAAEDEHFALLAYCFMPDHMHLIVQGNDAAAKFKDFAGRAKQFSGYAYAKDHAGRLWQRYFFEHVLRDDETTEAAIRYVLANPVRAGLVSEPGKYPFIGSDVFVLAELLELFHEGRSG